MPPHTHYVEPYAGGLAVLLAKNPEGVSEVVNDLHGELTNFWRVLGDPDLFPSFVQRVDAIPFSEPEWERYAHVSLGSGSVMRAVAFFVRCRQSLAGRMTSFAPLSKTRTRRGRNEQVSAWRNAVEGLADVHARLVGRVAVLNRPALDVIREQDGPSTLFYLDPPYYHPTRVAVEVYAHEMSESDHIELLACVRGVRGKVMLSGYPSPLYDTTLSGWTMHDFDIPNHAATGAVKRRMTERVWCNF